MPEADPSLAENCHRCGRVARGRRLSSPSAVAKCVRTIFKIQSPEVYEINYPHFHLDMYDMIKINRNGLTNEGFCIKFIFFYVHTKRKKIAL